MGHHGHDLVPFPVFHHAAAGVHVPHLLKAQIPGDILRLSQGSENMLPVGHAFLGLAPGNGGDADQRLQILHLLIKAGFDDAPHVLFSFASIFVLLQLYLGRTKDATLFRAQFTAW